MKFILLYTGEPAPPNASHKGWMTFFASLGDALVDKGSPMSGGAAVHTDGSVGGTTNVLNGYSIIRAKDKKEAAELIKDHPYLKIGKEYKIDIFAIR